MEESHHEDNIRVLIAEPGKKVYAKEIRNDWREMQMIVGGLIQAVYPSRKDAIAVVCNDEGKLLGLPMNRALTDDHGVPYDFVCGTFFMAGVGREDFISLTEQQIEKYQKKYANEMVFSVPARPEPHKNYPKKEKHKHER